MVGGLDSNGPVHLIGQTSFIDVPFLRHRYQMATQRTSPAPKPIGATTTAKARTHAIELRVMRRHMDEVTSSREKSIDFLKRAGLVSATGKVKQLVRA